MKKILLPALLCCIAAVGLFAQNTKKTPPPNPVFSPSQLGIHSPRPASVPTAENQFGLPTQEPQPIPAFQRKKAAGSAVRIMQDKNGMPILFQGRTEASGASTNAVSATTRALDYLKSLNPARIDNPGVEFTVKNVQTDEQGNLHVRLTQVFQGVPVYGGEMIAHTKNGAFDMLNGRYFPTPRLQTTVPSLDGPAAVQKVIAHIGQDKVKTSWTTEELRLIGGQSMKTELVIYYPENRLNGERLAWRVEAHPNLLSRVVYFIDATNGEIILHYDHTCKIDGGRHENHVSGAPLLDSKTNITATNGQEPAALLGPVLANGLDLLDINRTFGAYEAGVGQIVLEDAGRPMFNANESTMPADPVGAIVTLNALNTSPAVQTNFDYNFVISTSTTFSDKTAVSGHYNAIKSYDYYLNKFGRNSINGAGGNVVSFINVADDDGSSMENAFWNGAAMWYGNGGSIFKKLARGLDVGGHEMTHGVIESTANLEYMNESGALNESFADVFGAMIDLGDWKIGEDVMQAGINPTNCLRDLQNPHNGVSSNSPWWQPNHVSEAVTGSSDNGGVHVNSGIPNHAYYLFATNAAVGTDKAEQVYYKALRDYLVKSSLFVDCRIAVIQAASDLYGSAVANAAAAAFTAVGINGSQAGGNYLGQLSPNTGSDFVVCVSEDGNDLNLALGNGTVLTPSLYTNGVKSRPSVSDNGQQIVFVNDAGYIYYVEISYSNGIQFQSGPISDDGIWRSAAISKDGRFVAALTDNQDNKVYVYDLSEPFPVAQAYFLYNPTYSGNQYITANVKYADVLEFDYSGEYLMYDAFNETANSQGDDLSYWDIGFLKFWNNGQFASTLNPFISKLFNSLPDNVNVADPSFAKNSPYVVAFDVFNVYEDSYDVFAANTETGDYGPVITDNGDLGWPVYTRLDDRLLFQRPFGFGGSDLYLQGLKASKIEPQGNAVSFIDAHQWGAWFANGSRSLMVGTDNAEAGGLQLAVSPNPTNGMSSLSLDVPAATEASISLDNMMGQTIQVRTLQLSSGKNQLDVDLQQVPSGTYVLRITTGSTGAAMKIVKE